MWLLREKEGERTLMSNDGNYWYQPGEIDCEISSQVYLILWNIIERNFWKINATICKKLKIKYS